MSEHTPGRWKAMKGGTPLDDDPNRWVVVLESPPHYCIASIENGAPGDTLETEAANAAYIVRACNSHDKLVAALKEALSHVRELRDAWSTGAIRECDGLGGTRSNRNVDVESVVQQALAEAGE